MEFPLASEARVVSGFGADRDGGSRRHKGTDILAPRLTPVLAVADGVVISIHSTPPDDCCWMMLAHTDGWRSLYVHLNNDSYLTDDGLGHGVIPGLEKGSEVKAGQVIGWVGDSGNAESTVPHLHFELRHPDGYSVDATPSLNAAAVELELAPHFGPYLDDDDLAIERYTSQLVTSGAHWPCDETGLKVCPNRLAQPQDTSELIGLVTGMVPPLIDPHDQTLAFADMFPGDTADQVTGCEEDCLLVGVTEGDVARLLAWIHQVNHFSRLDHEFEAETQVEVPGLGEAEQKLRFLGVLGVCQESPNNTRLITRGELLGLLHQWILDDPTLSCVQSAGPER